MGFDLLIHSPYFWFIFVSFFSGLSLNALVQNRGKRHDPEKFRTRKIIRILIYLSLALVFFILSILIPGGEKLKDIQLLFLFIVLTVIFFLALRFKKAIGLPLFVLGCASFVFLILFLQSLIAFTGETEIAKIKVLNMENDSMVLALDLAQSEDMRITMRGNYFEPQVKVVILEDFYVFLGAKTLYRFVGMSSYEQDKSSEMYKQLEIYPFENPVGISQWVYRFFADNEAWLPGVKVVQIDGPKKKAKVFQSYSLRVQYDSGVEIKLID